MKNYVSTTLEQFLNESKTVQLKRQYKDVPSTIVNTNAPIRNEVINYVNENVKVPKEKLKKFIASINESNVPNASIMWLKRNSTFFLKENRKGIDYIKLSPLGKKLVEKMNCEINEGCGCGKKKPPVKRSHINEDEYNINLNIANKEIVKDEIPSPDFTPVLSGIKYDNAPESVQSEIEPYENEEDFHTSIEDDLEKEPIDNKDIEDLENTEDTVSDETVNDEDNKIDDIEDDIETSKEPSDEEVDMENMNADIEDDEDEKFKDLNSDDEEVENSEIDDEIAYDPEIDETEPTSENIEENEKLEKRPTDEYRAYDFKDKGKTGLLDEEIPEDKEKDILTEEDEDIKLTESKKEEVLRLISKIQKNMLLEAEAAKNATAPEEDDELNSDDLNSTDDTDETTDDDQTDDTDETTDDETTDDEDEKVEITEFVLSVENVEDSLKELEELGVNAEKVPTGEDDENGDPVYEEDQIKVSADQWEELKGWLEEKGVDITELFGGEVEVEGENDEADDIDFNGIDFELEDSDEDSADETDDENTDNKKTSEKDTDLEKSEIPKKKSKDLNESAPPLNEFLGAIAGLVAGTFVGYKALKAMWNNRNSLYKSIISTGVSAAQMKKIDEMVAEIKKNTVATISDNVKTYIANTKDMRQRRAKRLKQNLNIDALDATLEKESKKLITGIGEVLLAKAKTSMNELYASLAASKRLTDDQKAKIKQYWDLKMKIINSDIANQLAEQKLLFVHEAGKAATQREDAKVNAQKSNSTTTQNQGATNNVNQTQTQTTNPAVNAGTI